MEAETFDAAQIGAIMRFVESAKNCSFLEEVATKRSCTVPKVLSSEDRERHIRSFCEKASGEVRVYPYVPRVRVEPGVLPDPKTTGC